jgi:hypothetical protein
LLRAGAGYRQRPIIVAAATNQHRDGGSEARLAQLSTVVTASIQRGARMQRGITILLEVAMAIQALSIPLVVCGQVVRDGSHTVIHIYDMTRQPANADDYDEVAALATMQGIINRDKPILYINNDGYGRPKYWLDIMSKDGRWLEGVERRTITDLDDVYRLAAAKLKGAVIWDPEVPASMNVATTIAGVEDAVVFSLDLFAKQHPEEQCEVVDLYTFFDLFKQHYE